MWRRPVVSSRFWEENPWSLVGSKALLIQADPGMLFKYQTSTIWLVVRNKPYNHFPNTDTSWFFSWLATTAVGK